MCVCVWVQDLQEELNKKVRAPRCDHRRRCERRGCPGRVCVCRGEQGSVRVLWGMVGHWMEGGAWCPTMSLGDTV